MSEYIPPLNPLLSFVTAAQCGDVVQAAQRLNVTAAAVRKSVNTLETYLGVQLFQRRRGRLQLTEAGAFYLNGLEGAFERIDTATRALLFREQRETLTICAKLTPSEERSILKPSSIVALSVQVRVILLEETAVAVRLVGASRPGMGVGVGLGTPSREATAPAASSLPQP